MKLGFHNDSKGEMASGYGSPDAGSVEKAGKGKAHSAGLWCEDTLGRTPDLCELGTHNGAENT